MSLVLSNKQTLRHIEGERKAIFVFNMVIVGIYND